MTTRVDQRTKGQANHQSSQPQQQGVPQQAATTVNGTAPGEPRARDMTRDQNAGGGYDYGQFMTLPQQAAAYNTSMPMSSPTAADSFMSMSNYYQSMSFPGSYLGDSTAWSSGTDNLSGYVGSYGQVGNEFMQYAPFDFSQGFGWPGYSPNDYAGWGNGQQATVDGSLKMDGTGVMYPEYYQTNANSASSPHQQYLSSNGEPVEPLDVQEIENGMQRVTVSGAGDAPVNGQASPNEAVQPVTSVSVPNSSSATTNSSAAPAPSKKMSWANVASQPAKPVPVKPPPQILARPPPTQQKHVNSGEPGQWGDKPNSNGPRNTNGQAQQAPRNAWNVPRSQRTNGSTSSPSNSASHGKTPDTTSSEPSPVLDKLKESNSYNPKTFDLAAKGARFFIIKSYSEDDIHRAIKYSIWCSTEHGNKRLDTAFKEREGKGPVYLLYSVNGSGHFCGMAQMLSGVDYSTQSSVWTQDKWKGRIEIKWIYVKDVPNNQLRHIRLENNENKPVTNSRDTQEVPPEKGKQVLKIIHTYRHTTSIFDDFSHYEKKQVEDDHKRNKPVGADSPPSSQASSRRQ